MIVLGLAGQAGAGKDSVADYLVRRYGFIKFSFSDALYREVAQAFGLADESLLRDRATKELPTYRLSLRECKDATFLALARALAGSPLVETFDPVDQLPLSPRQILQWWGTEYRRAQDPDYWVKRAAEFVFGLRAIFEYPEQAPQLFVNTSVRFENERAWVRKMGGNVWYIHRDNLNAVAEHVSETPLPVLPPERELWNNYTLEYLHKGVEQLLNTDAKFVRMEPPAPPPEQVSIKLDVVSEAPTCRRCGGTMLPGQAIAQTWAGTPEWPGDTLVTMSPAGPGALIECLKCEKCGHSVGVGEPVQYVEPPTQ